MSGPVPCVVESGFRHVLDAVACFRPVSAWQQADGSVVFSERRGAAKELTLPCGQCVGCRIARARSWSLRCVHEASLHKLNCFVTLTYSPAKLPPHGSLRYRDFQLFMKRLRKQVRVPVRFFVCGEYGEQLSRPHYHACLFGYDFPDKTPTTLLGKPGGFRSALLERLWTHGHTHLGDLNVRSAGYAARYILKKVTGDPAESHYSVVDGDGVVHRRAAEFARMSLRPGVGHGFFQKFRTDVFPCDYIVHEGRQYPVPKYYDKLLDRSEPDLLATVKESREVRALPFRADGSPERLAVREVVERARISTLKRAYET